jgi:hypothetical protein
MTTFGGDAMKKIETGRLLMGLVAFSCTAMLSFNCGSPGKVGTPDNGSGGGGSAGQNSISLIAGAAGTATPTGGNTAIPTLPDGTCGTTTNDTKRAQADVLIVLDRTDSMKWSLTSDQSECRGNDPNCTSRMAVVVPAVGAVVTDNPDISWGLEFFTTPNSSGYCTVSSTPQVEVRPNTADAIKLQLAAYTTQLSTPTALAINVATDYLKTVNDGNNKVILLATDGLPNCAANARDWNTEDMPGATAAVTAAKNAGFPVYVIGIGPSTSTTNLNNLAVAGGTTNYYPATSTTELSAALNSIAKVVSATCTFKANMTPPEKDLVYVYVDKKLVAKDDSKGWTFDKTDSTYSTIVLTGSYCEDILSGVTSQVQIVFGCPNSVPPGIIP